MVWMELDPRGSSMVHLVIGEPKGQGIREYVLSGEGLLCKGG
jgi:hypothetical protein